MINLFKYGASYKIVKIQLFLSWPIIKYGKKLSSLPLLKWMINPFFKRPHNELTAIPINKKIQDHPYSTVPLEITEKLISMMLKPLSKRHVSAAVVAFNTAKSQP